MNNRTLFLPMRNGENIKKITNNPWNPPHLQDELIYPIYHNKKKSDKYKKNTPLDIHNY